MTSRWSMTTRVTIFAALLILIGLLINAIRPLIAPMIVASLFAYTLYPLVVRLEISTRLSHTWAVVVVYFPFLAILIATPGTLIPGFIRQVQTLSDEFLNVLTFIEERLAEPVIILGRTVSQETLQEILGSVIDSVRPVPTDVIDFFEATSVSLLWFIVILVTTFYLLKDWHGLRDWIIGLFPDSEQDDIRRLMSDIDANWRAYIRGTLALMLIMGVFFIIVGLAIGLPGAVALGLFTGLLSMIPELGPTIAGILSVLVAFFEGSNFLPLDPFWFALLVGAIYLIVMQVKSLWLRPIVMGRVMHMNTGLVFVAIIGSALIFGVLAALIILPVLATAGQIGQYVRCKLLDESPWPEATLAVETDASAKADGADGSGKLQSSLEILEEG